MATPSKEDQPGSPADPPPSASPVGYRAPAAKNYRRAKFYRLTAGGRRRLDEQEASWNRLVAALTAVLTTKPQETWLRSGLPGRSALPGLRARVRSLWRGVRRRRAIEAEISEEFRECALSCVSCLPGAGGSASLCIPRLR